MAVYILGGARTPVGGFMGALSGIPATELGALALKGAVQRSEVDPKLIEQIYMGHVIQAGCGQAPARQVALKAGLPESVSAVTVNKVCGSGLQAIINAFQNIELGDAELVAAGGMENMSQAPHLIPQSRSGLKFGEYKLRDSMQWDGLWDVYTDRPMGNCAEECAKKYDLTREAQDAFATESFKRAQKSQASGVFAREIVAVEVKGQKVEHDEGPGKVNFEKMLKLKPAFDSAGTITAANASSINDGAAALILGGEKYKEKAKFKIHSYAFHAQNPTWFTTAPIEAIKKNLKKSGLKLEQIDFFEINEAFALVPMVAMKELGIPAEKTNIYGGAVSLGHPIGCSGARIVLSLMNALENEKGRYGCASICIGGGEALSLVIERI